jgi:hypothetical protein
MITNEERIEVLSKIEKIMAHTQTESGAVNVNEIAIVNRLVKELMDKYEISIDEIKATPEKSTLVKNIESELIDQKGIRHWVMSLSSIIASFYECRIMRTSTKIFFIGFEMDAKVASKMFDHLYLQIYNAAIKATEIPTSISRKTRVIDFCVGALGALSNRLDKIKEERKYQESKNALVIVKKDIVEKQMDKMYPGSVSKFDCHVRDLQQTTYCEGGARIINPRRRRNDTFIPVS